MNKKLISGIIAILIMVVGGWAIIKYSKKTPITETQENQSTTTETNQNSEKDNEQVPASNIEVTTTQDQVNQLFKKAVTQESNGDYIGAKASLDSALKIKPNDPYITSYYASLYFHMKDYSNALVWINKALTYRPSDPNFWTIKVDIIKAQSGNVEQTFLDAIAKTNTNINMVTSYASWLGQIGRKQDAIAQWNKAIQIYPKNKAIYQTEIDLLSK